MRSSPKKAATLLLYYSAIKTVWSAARGGQDVESSAVSPNR